jgi:hypothetical protein
MFVDFLFPCLGLLDIAFILESETQMTIYMSFAISSIND